MTAPLRPAVALAMLASLAPAGARADAWLVLPAVSGDLPADLVDASDRLEAGLAERGLRVIEARRPADLGSDPQAVPRELELDLLNAVEPALEDAAYGRRARVLERVNPLLDRAGRYLDALGSRPDAARAVADLALILARAHLEGGDRTSADAVVRRLLTLVPAPEPTAQLHPQDVLALAGRLRARRDDGAGDARLAVAAPRSCTAYLNGQQLGPTPARVPVYAGDYAVRVRCADVRSRVHRAHVERGEVTITVRPSLEAAFAAAPRTHLRYADRADLAARAAADGRALARLVGASHVLLVRPSTSPERLRAEVHLATGSGAVGTVELQRPAGDVTPVVAAALAVPAAPEDVGATRPSPWSWAVGGALIAGGLVALAFPVYSLANEGSATGCAETEASVRACRSRVAFGGGSIALSVVGLALLTGGILWLALSPLRVSVVATGTSAGVLAEGTF